ncbi:MAG: DUF1588 domain-containing protein, partial [Myxococcales bacterium]|nr:DUF1588 domain-containing protein [Myxococcales bacterium]
WLRVSGVVALEKSAEKFPEFTEDVRRAALEETSVFFEREVFEHGSSIREWFTTERAYFGETLASVYGAPVPVDGVSDWGDAPRSGLLGHASWLATFAGSESNVPTKRGKFVLEDLLCGTLPPPPAVAMTMPVAPPDGEHTTRERFEVHGENGCTKGCHDSMDPIGYAFEHFNAIGAFQATENNKSIDASGHIELGDVQGDFTDARDLGELITAGNTVPECFAGRWFELALARPLEGPDYCSRAKVQKMFVDAAGDFRELLVGIITSDAFRTREVCAP